MNFTPAIAVDEAGNLYICDRDNNCVRRVDGRGFITTLLVTDTPRQKATVPPLATQV